MKMPNNPIKSHITDAKETFRILMELSRLLCTGLDPETLTICIRLCEEGINPEALATIVRELRKEVAYDSNNKDKN